MKNFILLNWVGIVLCLSGIFGGGIVSYYFYRKSIKVAIPAIQYSHQSVIDIDEAESDENLKISYDGENISRLTKRLFIFGTMEVLQ